MAERCYQCGEEFEDGDIIYEIARCKFIKRADQMPEIRDMGEFRHVHQKCRGLMPNDLCQMRKPA
ncbi:MAG: hypothetical protein ABEJ56_00050 [Candidatus Nanohaloarchaea archaeon]